MNKLVYQRLAERFQKLKSRYDDEDVESTAIRKMIDDLNETMRLLCERKKFKYIVDDDPRTIGCKKPKIKTVREMETMEELRSVMNEWNDSISVKTTNLRNQLMNLKSDVDSSVGKRTIMDMCSSLQCLKDVANEIVDSEKRLEQEDEEMFKNW